jgi:hypothetical protein
VTTIDAAAAWSDRSRIARAALVILVAAGLAGCSTSGPDLLFTTQTPAAKPASPAQPVRTAEGQSRILIAQVVGAPENIEREIIGNLTRSLQAKNISVTQSATDKSDYTLRGYVVAARESGGTKVSYIWDVYTPKDHRVNRITGEEFISGAGAGDPWASVSGQIVATITNKTATTLAAWMPKKATPPPGAATPPIASAPQASPVSTAAVPRQPASLPAHPTNGAAPPSVASAPSATSVQAIVPHVSGAPGDGAVSLAQALQRELKRNGVSQAPPGAAVAYRVEGKVEIGPGNGGKQPIKIDWVVKDPAGRHLGTVSQKNEIPAGSLNGSWGATADAAAAAATQGILRLLPTTRRDG